MVIAMWAICLSINVMAKESEELTKPMGEVSLAWKFAEGDQMLYRYDIHSRERQTQEGMEITEETTLSVWAQWNVIKMEDKLACVLVTFPRIRKEFVTPDGVLSVDTFSPRDPRGKEALVAEQEKAFRALDLKYIFFAMPDGGVAWAEDLMPADSVPEFLRVPETTEYLSPQVFTTGDSLALPGRAVFAGERWNQPVHGAHDPSASATYTFAGSTRRDGRLCMVIDGVTRYGEPPAGTHENARFVLAPRLSRHYFDAHAGRLVDGEEHFSIVMDAPGGVHRETKTDLTRKLLSPPTGFEKQKVSRRLADGGSREFVFLNGMPENARSEWAEVVGSGLQLGMDSDTKVPKRVVGMSWAMMLDVQGRSIQSLELHDVSGSEPRPLAHEREVTPQGQVLLYFDRQTDDSDEVHMICTNAMQERIIKVVVKDASGATAVLYQPILTRCRSLRTSGEYLFPDSP